MRRDHVASTLIRRHFDVMCLLGLCVRYFQGRGTFSNFAVFFFFFFFFIYCWHMNPLKLQDEMIPKSSTMYVDNCGDNIGGLFSLFFS